MACQGRNRAAAATVVAAQAVEEVVDIRTIPAAVQRVRQHFADNLVVLGIRPGNRRLRL